MLIFYCHQALNTENAIFKLDKLSISKQVLTYAIRGNFDANMNRIQRVLMKFQKNKKMLFARAKW